MKRTHLSWIHHPIIRLNKSANCTWRFDLVWNSPPPFGEKLPVQRKTGSWTERDLTGHRCEALLPAGHWDHQELHVSAGSGEDVRADYDEQTRSAVCRRLREYSYFYYFFNHISLWLSPGEIIVLGHHSDFNKRLETCRAKAISARRSPIHCSSIHIESYLGGSSIASSSYQRRWICSGFSWTFLSCVLL